MQQQGSLVITPFGFGTGSMSGDADLPTTVKQVVGPLVGYRVIQDQSRPEYALITRDGVCVGEMTIGLSQVLHKISFRSRFLSAYSLVFQAELQRPPEVRAVISSARIQPFTVNIDVSFNDPDHACAVYQQLLKAGRTILLRADVNINLVKGLGSALTSHHVDLIPVADLYFPDGFEDLHGSDSVVVCRVTDELIGYTTSTQNTKEPQEYSLRLVTPLPELIETVLGI